MSRLCIVFVLLIGNAFLLTEHEGTPRNQAQFSVEPTNIYKGTEAIDGLRVILLDGAEIEGNEINVYLSITPITTADEATITKTASLGDQNYETDEGIHFGPFRPFGDVSSILVYVGYTPTDGSNTEVFLTTPAEIAIEENPPLVYSVSPAEMPLYFVPLIDRIHVTPNKGQQWEDLISCSAKMMVPEGSHQSAFADSYIEVDSDGEYDFRFEQGSIANLETYDVGDTYLIGANPTNGREPYLFTAAPIVVTADPLFRVSPASPALAEWKTLDVIEVTQAQEGTAWTKIAVVVTRHKRTAGVAGEDVIVVDRTPAAGTRKFAIPITDAHRALLGVEKGTYLSVHVSPTNDPSALLEIPDLLNIQPAPYVLEYVVSPRTVAPGATSIPTLTFTIKQEFAAKFKTSPVLAAVAVEIPDKMAAFQATWNKVGSTTPNPLIFTATDIPLEDLGPLEEGDSFSAVLCRVIMGKQLPVNDYIIVTATPPAEETFTISPSSFLFQRPLTTPKVEVIPSEGAGWAAGLKARFSLPSAAAASHNAGPIEVDLVGEGGGFVVPAGTDLSSLGLGGEEDGAVTVEVFNGAKWLAHKATLTVAIPDPAFTIAPATLTPDDLASTPAFTLAPTEGGGVTIGALFAVKFVKGEAKVVVADIAATGAGTAEDPFVHTVPAAQDLSPLGLSTFPATVAVFLAPDNTQYLEDPATITVGGTGDAAVGRVVPLAGVVMGLFVLLSLLF